jgi:hypothetical protein
MCISTVKISRWVKYLVILLTTFCIFLRVFVFLILEFMSVFENVQVIIFLVCNIFLPGVLEQCIALLG